MLKKCCWGGWKRAKVGRERVRGDRNGKGGSDWDWGVRRNDG